VKRWFKRAAGASADLFCRVFYDPFMPAEQVSPDREAALLSEYREISQHSAPTEGIVEDEWAKFRRRIRDQIQTSPRRFLRILPLSTCLSLGNTSVSYGAWKYLRKSPQWDRYRKVLKEDSLGVPERFLFMPSSGGNQIHHTCHICTFEEKTNTRIEDLKLILDFGGGYGGFCRQVHRMGFKGKYIILDLPELSALQRYYLSSLGFTILPKEKWADPAASGIVLVTDIEEGCKLVESLHTALKPAMFVATWSLSETPAALRAPILKAVTNFEHYLIAYQPVFGSVNNVEYFHEFVASSPHKEGWNHYRIPHNPTCHYLIR
jgi:hypothetical protein